jgi:two-component system, cell cycle sensor histidine kinase and response regulator CckA
MVEFLRQLLSSGDFMPHGHCYLWDPGLVWLRVISDGLIALAYFVIPFVLVHFARKRRDLPFNWMFVAFGVFIVACGLTHVTEIWNLWHAEYWLAGVIKAITAIASVPTAVLLIRLVPKALAVPTSEELKSANQALEEEIRERRKVEASLRKGEARFRDLLESAPDAMVIVDRNGRIVLSNTQTEKVFGYSKSEMLGQAIDMLIPQRFREKHAKHLGSYFSTPHMRPMGDATKLFGVHKRGSEFPAEISLSILQTDDEFFVSCAIRDITKRKRVEEELARSKCELEQRVTERTRELLQSNRVLEEEVKERRRAEGLLRASEARYREVVENATRGIYRVRANGAFLDVNPALVSMLGYSSKEELLCRNLVRDVLRNPSDFAPLAEQYERTGRADAEMEWTRKDGRPITVRISGRRSKDGIQGSEFREAIVEDITERRALEKQLQQAQKFEAIGQLAGGIAHDFNNMIGAIMGWAELGMEDSPREDRLHSFFLKVRQQAERAAALTRQLLAFARRQILAPRDLNLNDVLHEVLSLLEKVIGRDVEVKTNLGANLGAVRADPTQIEQILMNLCLNARDAMPNGGVLSITTQNAELDEAARVAHSYVRPGQHVLLTVSDTGTGMDAATLERIFEPFFTTKGPGKGTGLGLATVYGIVKQHGGVVLVDSKPREGSRFRVYLPVSPSAAETAATDEAEEPVAGGKECILLVEDHGGLQEIARETLEQFGYLVLLADDGEEAVEKFQANCDRISLVVMDVILPKLSGLESYARMQGIRPGLPALIVTGYSADTNALEEIRSQGLPLLQKPYSPRTLARKVRETLDHAALNLRSTIR